MRSMLKAQIDIQTQPDMIQMNFSLAPSHVVWGLKESKYSAGNRSLVCLPSENSSK
jgi:hypothetical protein